MTALLAASVAPVLASYRRWLGYLENREAKGFSVSPIWDVRAHFIKLDTTATFALLEAEGLFAGNLPAFRADPTPATENAFRLDKLVAARSGLKSCWRRPVARPGQQQQAHTLPWAAQPGAPASRTPESQRWRSGGWGGQRRRRG